MRGVNTSRYFAQYLAFGRVGHGFGRRRSKPKPRISVAQAKINLVEAEARVAALKAERRAIMG